jgi:hypothetical protein
MVSRVTERNIAFIGIQLFTPQGGLQSESEHCHMLLCVGASVKTDQPPGQEPYQTPVANRIPKLGKQGASD